LQELTHELIQSFCKAHLCLHKRQWTCLGHPSDEKPEFGWIIDLEALTVSTLALGLTDRSLLTTALRLMTGRREWFNLSRYKRIAKLFNENSAAGGRPVIDDSLFACMPDSLSQYTQFGNKKRSKTAGSEYKAFFRDLDLRAPGEGLNLLQPALTQLLLRGVFGIDARAEMMIYLLSHESGNSNSIARELFFDQKAVYRIIERWKAAGIVETVPEERPGNVYLKRKEPWAALLGNGRPAGYYNWVRLFGLCAVVNTTLSNGQDSGGNGIADLLFRSLYENARAAARPLDVEVPDPKFIQEGGYMTSFVSTITGILEVLNK